MSYLIFARKYRPQKFGDLTGQETISKILQSALFNQRIAPAYLFSGPRGTGKTTTARIFAKTLNCHKRIADSGQPPLASLASSGPSAISEKQKTTSKNANPVSGIQHPVSDIEPCNECSSCLEISKGNAIDVLEIDAASHTDVDNIRQVIIDTVAFAPARDRFKIFIIDEVHMLSKHSFNALLKTLEEPPAHAAFILCTTEFHKIPITIISRCQKFRFLPLTSIEIFQTLEKMAGVEKISISKEGLSLIAKSAGGSMRDALSLFDQVISHCSSSTLERPSTIGLGKVQEVLGTVREDLLTGFIRQTAQKNMKGVLESIDQILKEGYDLSYFLKEVRESFRKMLIEKCGYKDSRQLDHSKSELPTSEFSVEQLLRNSQLLSKCADQMRWNDFPRMVFECFAVRLCQETVDIEELFDRIEKIQPRLNNPDTGLRGNRIETLLPNKSWAGETVNPQPEPGDKDGQNDFAEAVPKQNHLTSADLHPPKKNEDDGFKQQWGQVLSSVQDSKPSLFHTLQGASVQCLNDKVELALSNSFALAQIKKNALFLEELIRKFSDEKLSLAIKLETSRTTPKNEDISLKMTEGLSGGIPIDETSDLAEDNSATEIETGEIFEVAEHLMPLEKELAVEDEGLKNFLTAFTGKLTKLDTTPS